MTPEKECERLRAENDMLRATLTAAADALIGMRGKLDSLSAGLATVDGRADKIIAGLATMTAAADGIIAIVEAMPRPFEAARAARSRRSRGRAERAIALRDRGLSWPQIGLRMATEDGRVYPAGEDCAGQVWPYAPTTVYRWLRAQKG
jgi:hypothetical protein